VLDLSADQNRNDFVVRIPERAVLLPQLLENAHGRFGFAFRIAQLGSRQHKLKADIRRGVRDRFALNKRLFGIDPRAKADIDKSILLQRVSECRSVTAGTRICNRLRCKLKRTLRPSGV